MPIAAIMPLIAGMTTSVTTFCVALIAVSISSVLVKWLEAFLLD